MATGKFGSRMPHGLMCFWNVTGMSQKGGALPVLDRVLHADEEPADSSRGGLLRAGLELGAWAFLGTALQVRGQMRPAAKLPDTDATCKRHVPRGAALSRHPAHLVTLVISIIADHCIIIGFALCKVLSKQ